ncbi:hypothetical protein K440DRAFT_683088 [Wilcoxina mikolae CBS 423.85]|nr:hypothetical protein K440DRAFT_683088 [Wilcoxina mikolae CBS 423.85]
MSTTVQVPEREGLLEPPHNPSDRNSSKRRGKSPLSHTILRVTYPRKSTIPTSPFYSAYRTATRNDGLALQDSIRIPIVQSVFGPQTDVLVVNSCSDRENNVEVFQYTERELLRFLAVKQDVPLFQLFYITMNSDEQLRISARAFERMATCYNLPLAFVEAILRYQRHLLHFGSRFQISESENSLIYDFWYMLPVRIPMECIDPVGAHKEFISGRNQMNPFHLLHLHEVKTDIRGFEIGVYFRYDCSSRKSTVICVNFHSRSSGPVEDVQHRILHALDVGGTTMINMNPFWVHLVYEKKIEERMLEQSERNPNVSRSVDITSVETNRALHAMTAHSLRYDTELATITSVVSELIQQHGDLADRTNQQAQDKDQVHRALKQQLAEVETIARTQNELAKKLKNTLALADHDQRQISNGQDLQEILRVNQGDAVNTFKLAKLTRDDGIAMKSIAVMTMAFLPATSFASADENVNYKAILALPYFQLSGLHRSLWIWGILSATLTAIIFIIFRLYLGKQRSKGDLELTDPEKRAGSTVSGSS